MSDGEKDTIVITLPNWVTEKQRAEIEARTKILISEILKEKAPTMIEADVQKT